jgi:Ligated ion channel L-glutamate- and glycine-binding site
LLPFTALFPKVHLVVQADLVPAPADSPATYTNYRGYEIDLIKSISGLLNFNYDFFNPEDGSWGHINPQTADWNGLIAKARN